MTDLHGEIEGATTSTVDVETVERFGLVGEHRH